MTARTQFTFSAVRVRCFVFSACVLLAWLLYDVSRSLQDAYDVQGWLRARHLGVLNLIGEIIADIGPIPTMVAGAFVGAVLAALTHPAHPALQRATALAHAVKQLATISFGIGLVAAGVTAIAFRVHHEHGNTIASLHRFVPPEQPKLLTEELAMTYGKQALAQDGLDTDVWQPVHDFRLAAWGASAGGFAVRNPNNSNHFCIAFRCGKPPTRFVSVYLFEGGLICSSSVER